MLTKRIIPCLDIANGRTVKGTNFLNIRDAGDPVELACRYEREGADELVLLDIRATVDQQENAYQLVEEIARSLRIPFTIGGGIQSVDHAEKLLNSGADKIAVNSILHNQPQFTDQLAKQLGSQAVVAAVDAKWIDDDYYVVIHGGRTRTMRRVSQWIDELCQRGAGEILLTSMDADGTKNGFWLDLYRQLSQKIPVIASGGAGTIAHFLDLFEETDVSAALAASIFHFQEISINQLKIELANSGLLMRREMEI
ncbi:MAG: imidazole glycerol phosphate synthase subunit HisF [Calditrichaeota bacterium]|nr:imidazole glycerol phosphate synthase subunit HisF [Calditrichota bacterium]